MTKMEKETENANSNNTTDKGRLVCSLSVIDKQQRQITLTANDHAKSAIIAQLRTVLRQAKQCLPTIKKIAAIGARGPSVATKP